jgi:hypothetical protein
MWPSIALAALVILFLIPATRPILIWLVLVPLVPLIVRFGRRLPPGFAPVPIAADDPRLHPNARAAFDRRTEQLAPLGFTPSAIFLLDRGRNQPVTFLSILSHDPTRTRASVSYMVHSAQVSQTLELTTRFPAFTLVTLTSPLPTLAPDPRDITHHLPSLREPEQLWTVHQALLARHAASDALPPPASPVELAAYISNVIAEEIQRFVNIGVLRRRRDGAHHFTWSGAFRLGAREIWPKRQRLAAAVRADETRLLADLGLTSLLNHARAPAESAPAPERALLRTPDDRGEARTVANNDRAQSDERSGDPRFRALVAQSAATRRATFAGNGLITVFITMVSVVGLRALGVPFLAAFAIAFITSMVVFAFRNKGRAVIAERAAADVYLRRGLCASCLYSLAGLEPAPDGCLSCPECGSAWKRDRIVDFAAFTTASESDGLAATRRVGEMLTRSAGDFSAGSRAKDHRNQPCTLIPPTLRHHLATAPEPLRPRLAAARKRIRRSGRLLRMIVTVVIAIVFITPPVALLTLRGFGAGRYVILSFFMLAFGILLTLGVARGNFAYRKRDIIRAMLDQRLCPSCAEDLTPRTPNPPAPDGLTTCICGHSWRTT